MSCALVLGLGRSGKAARALLERDGVAVTALDESSNTTNYQLPTTNFSSQLPTTNFSRAVVSPGIALTHPWVDACRARGIPLESELALGCRELRRRGVRLLAVTGSKGKSSVVKIVAEALSAAGHPAVACGNYGLPVCEVALRETLPEWAVVEVSSFMMETTELASDTFEAAAILNLQEDHLDRHGSVAVYHGLKRKLLTMAKVPLGPTADIADAAPLFAGSYFDNEVLCGNGALAVALMRVALLDDAQVAAAFRAFEPLPHRMNLVGEVGGVRCIDDSKATSLAALEAGVKMASAHATHGAGRVTIRLIAGGLAKGDDPKDVVATLAERVAKVYLIGRCADDFAAAWSPHVACASCETLARAVASALGEANPGETLLLSPGTASFDQFKSFGERGETFARLVREGPIETLRATE